MVRRTRGRIRIIGPDLSIDVTACRLRVSPTSLRCTFDARSMFGADNRVRTRSVGGARRRVSSAVQLGRCRSRPLPPGASTERCALVLIEPVGEGDSCDAALLAVVHEPLLMGGELRIELGEPFAELDALASSTEPAREVCWPGRPFRADS